MTTRGKTKQTIQCQQLTADMPIRCGIYIRVSTEEQVEGHGLDVQQSQCEAYAAAYGLIVVKVYTDAGLSGTLSVDDRPGMKEALRAASNGEIDIILFSKMDRIARKAGLILSIWEQIEKTGCSVVCVKERIDTTTAVGRMFRTVIAAFTELERDTILERTSDGMNKRAEEDGEKGGRLPYGYVRKEHLEIDPDEAQVVRFVFHQRFVNHSPLRNIAYQLNQGGFIKPRLATKWRHSTVQSILLNEDYYRGATRNDSPVAFPIILD